MHRYTKLARMLLPVACLLACLPARSLAQNPYQVDTIVVGGKEVAVYVFPGRPPANRAPEVRVPFMAPAAETNILASMPAFYWSYGCSPTAAAMMMGYYDLNGYPNLYTGPANGGVCPQTNSTWGFTQYASVMCGECPLSASHQGVDGRTTPGHVDDYWVDFNNTGVDPFSAYGRVEHAPDSCADFMGTSQRARGNADGSTLFAIATDGSRLDDYLGPIRDGCYGMKLFANSRGYTVSEAFSQCIYPNPVYTQITQGFTFADYKAEIDAGRPVMIQVQGHTMVGYGYSDTGNLVYLRDTWDYNPHTSHTMPWGGYYNNGQNMRHFAVTVFRLAAPGAVYDEDFETGDLTRCAWQTGGDAPWSVTDAEPHSPRFSVRAGAIGNRQVSWLEVTLTGMAGEVSFYRRVSSQPNGDRLRFLIDGEEKGQWHGEQTWGPTPQRFAVTAGTHTYRWEYVKDGSVAAGLDTAWLDDLSFPPGALAVAMRGLRATRVADGTVRLQWSAADGPDVVGYRIWRTGPAGGRWIQVCPSLVQPDRRGACRYIDRKAPPRGEGRRYRVDAVDSSGRVMSSEQVAVPR